MKETTPMTKRCQKCQRVRPDYVHRRAPDADVFDDVFPRFDPTCAAGGYCSWEVVSKPLRKRSIELRSDTPICEDGDLAADIVREVVLAGGAHSMKIVKLELEYCAICVTLYVPPMGEFEPAYMHEMSALLLEAVTRAADKHRSRLLATVKVER
jgi:hypothetical protein